MDLAGVQAAVGPCYTRMLSWSQQGDIIKAVPKKRMSNLAFNVVSRVFKRLGGHYVSRGGQAWFELVVEQFGAQPNDSYSTLRGNATLETSSSALSLGLIHQQPQLERLGAAGCSEVRGGLNHGHAR